jgi:FkbM family methyltransferase
MSNVRGLIYDVGFHTGQDAAYYLARGWRVVAVEANPQLVERGKEHFASEIRSGKLIILNVGIAERSDEMPFFINPDHSEYSSFDRDIAGRDTSRLQEIVVPARRLSEIVRQFGPAHYIKIDIEGYDHCAIASLHDDGTPRPKYISMENGQERGLNTLKELGYSRFSWVNQAEVCKMRIPPSSSEGRRIDWQFPRGASGLFGSDLHWISFEEVLHLSKSYWDNPARDPSMDGWFDAHAAL